MDAVDAACTSSTSTRKIACSSYVFCPAHPSSTLFSPDSRRLHCIGGTEIACRHRYMYSTVYSLLHRVSAPDPAVWKPFKSFRRQRIPRHRRRWILITYRNIARRRWDMLLWGRASISNIISYTYTCSIVHMRLFTKIDEKIAFKSAPKTYRKEPGGCKCMEYNWRYIDFYHHCRSLFRSPTLFPTCTYARNENRC